jgi:hypothetical protein
MSARKVRLVETLYAPSASPVNLLSKFKDPVTGAYFYPKLIDADKVSAAAVKTKKEELTTVRSLKPEQLNDLLARVRQSGMAASFVETWIDNIRYWRDLPQSEFEAKMQALSQLDTECPRVLPASSPMAIVDSGFMYDHPFLKGCVDADYSVDFTGEGLEDLNGHGTLCALMTTNGGKLKFRWLNVKVIGQDGLGSEKNLLKALKWLTAYSLRHPDEHLNISLSVGVYSKKWGVFECRGNCRVCRAAVKLADTGATLTVAAGNRAGETSCPAKAGLLHKHVNIGAIAAAYYSDSGTGSVIVPSTTRYMTSPCV